ncbi:hypothetical protein K443DRAFT_221344 [Laccaria amethystina LaAM-08-1]|uniref:Uncharacterized protein n=1 Tax=Laccaria amethystina LaAM-08-1 TaxID=1095629 RepID=A0A0C9WMD2_9AGAR|nr:hypothetical protein K443DRAFT_221344 [Laccaria amethystina LaAM-08-1]
MREGGRWRGHTRSTSISPSYLSPGTERHETQLEHIQHHRQYLLLPLTEHQGAVNAKRRRLFPCSVQQPSGENVEPSKDRKTKEGWKERCWKVRDESALDRKRDFLSCVERSSGGRSMGSRCPL